MVSASILHYTNGNECVKLLTNFIKKFYITIEKYNLLVNATYDISIASGTISLLMCTYVRVVMTIHYNNYNYNYNHYFNCRRIILIHTMY